MAHSWQKSPRLHFMGGTDISTAAQVAIMVHKSTYAKAVLFRFNGVELSVPRDGNTVKAITDTFFARL